MLRRRPGHARALREHADGRTIALARFGPGDIFGELAMFDDERRSATVEAIDDLQALAILGPDMRRLMREPRTSRSSSTSLGRRLRAANERLARQSFQTVQSRVASVIGLIEQARAEGGRTATSSSPRRRPSSRSSPDPPASRRRFLAVLERAGIVTQGRGKLTVHDPSALAATSTECETSYGGRRRLRGDELLRDHARAPASAVLALPKGHVEHGETPEQDAAREVREESGRRRRTSSSSSARSATGTSATAGGSPRSSRSSSSSTARRHTADHDHEVEEARWIALEERPRSSATRGSARWSSALLSETRPALVCRRAGPELLLAVFADQLKRGRKTATIRLGDKSHKYRKNQAVMVTIGYQHSPREKIFEAVIDQVEVKKFKDLSPRDIEHDNPEFRRTRR